MADYTPPSEDIPAGEAVEAMAQYMDFCYESSWDDAARSVKTFTIEDGERKGQKYRLTLERIED